MIAASKSKRAQLGALLRQLLEASRQGDYEGGAAVLHEVKRTFRGTFEFDQATGDLVTQVSMYDANTIDSTVVRWTPAARCEIEGFIRKRRP